MESFVTEKEREDIKSFVSSVWPVVPFEQRSLIDIPAIVDLEKTRKRRAYPCHVNRASELGHPCARYLVYLRTKEKPLHSLGLQRIFDEGNLHHRAVVSDMRAAGIKVVEQERPFELKGYQITGHIDGKIDRDNRLLDFEIKGVEPHAWKKMNSVDDMLDSTRIWWQKYPGQLYLYLFMDCPAERPVGVFVLKNKLSAQLKQIDVPLDREYVEMLLGKAVTINQHISNGTLPAGMEPDEDICGGCGFNTECMPDRDFGDPLQLMQDAQLVGLLSRREELKELYREHEAINKQLKRELNGKNNIILESGGESWHISGKIIKRKAYVVKDGEYWKSKAVRLKG
jgi:hypothetical protein